MMIRVSGISPLLALFALHLAGTAAADTPGAALQFDTRGGDAWSFSKVISGTMNGNRCDAVELVSSLGRTRAQLSEDRFTATVPLRGGYNTVSAMCLYKGNRVGNVVRQSWNVRLLDIPAAHAEVSIEGDAVLINARSSTVAPGVPAPLVRYSWRPVATNPAQLEVLRSATLSITSVRGPLLRLRSPKIDGDYRVSLSVRDAFGRNGKGTVLFRVVDGKAVAIDIMHEHPDWRACTILYGVAPALFGSGGLADVARRLEEISSLGITALWLSPVTDAPPGDFGYSLTDPFRVRRSLGSSAELRSLITKAHAHGMRVLLDFVTNHLSKEHPYFLNTVRFGRRSPYFSWFERDHGDQPTHYFDWTSLENLNYGNVEVRNYVLAAVTYWFRNFPIDGFRADAAWAIRQRDPAFWPVMRAEVENIHPGVLLIAEASARDPYYTSQGFDAAYDWTAELGLWAWQGVFGPGGQPPNLRLLRAALTNDGSVLADSAGVLHFLNNNDTGKRFITVHGLLDTRLAAALLLTIPGIPLIYAGDEVGASFQPYAHPSPIRWSDPNHLAPFYRRLIRLRLQIPALRSSTLRWVHTSRDASVLAYIRKGSKPDRDVAVVLNFGASSFALPLASVQSENVPAVSWQLEDLLTGTSTGLPPDRESIWLAPHGAILLRRAVAASSDTLSSSCSERSHG